MNRHKLILSGAFALILLTAATTSGVALTTNTVRTTNNHQATRYVGENAVTTNGYLIIRNVQGNTINLNTLKIKLNIHEPNATSKQGTLTNLPLQDQRLTPGHATGGIAFDHRWGAVNKHTTQLTLSSSNALIFKMNETYTTADHATITLLNTNTGNTIETQTVRVRKQVPMALPDPNTFFKTHQYNPSGTWQKTGTQTQYDHQSPGSNWTKQGLDHYKQLQTGTQTTISPTRPGSGWARENVNYFRTTRSARRPGWGWERGQIVRYKSVQTGTQYRIATHSPGSSWSKGSFARYQRTQTGYRRTASVQSPGPGWQRTGYTTRTTTSTTRPGWRWKKETQVGTKTVQSGNQTTKNQTKPGPGWSKQGVANTTTVVTGTNTTWAFSNPGEGWTKTGKTKQAKNKNDPVSIYPGGPDGQWTSWKFGSSYAHKYNHYNGHKRKKKFWILEEAITKKCYAKSSVYIYASEKRSCNHLRNSKRWRRSEWSKHGKKEYNPYKGPYWKYWKYYESTGYKFYKINYKKETEYKYTKNITTTKTVYNWTKPTYKQKPKYRWGKQELTWEKPTYTKQPAYHWTKPVTSQKPVYKWRDPYYTWTQPTYTTQPIYKWTKPVYQQIGELIKNHHANWTFIRGGTMTRNSHITLNRHGLATSQSNAFTLTANGQYGAWTMQVYRTGNTIVITQNGTRVWNGTTSQVVINPVKNTITTNSGATHSVQFKLGTDIKNRIGTWNMQVENGQNGYGALNVRSSGS